MNSHLIPADHDRMREAVLIGLIEVFTARGLSVDPLTWGNLLGDQSFSDGGDDLIHHLDVADNFMVTYHLDDALVHPNTICVDRRVRPEFEPVYFDINDPACIDKVVAYIEAALLRDHERTVKALDFFRFD